MQINLITDYAVKGRYSEDVFSVLADQNDVRARAIGLLFGASLLASIFIICRWLFVSARQNHLAGVEGLRISPGWAVGWFFVPVANIVMPYRALREIYRASFRNPGWAENPVPYCFPAWWTFWIVTNLLSNASLRMEMRLGDDYTFEALNVISYVDIAADATGILCAYFLLKIVNVVVKNQQQEAGLSV
jgi:hypothetical protein